MMRELLSVFFFLFFIKGLALEAPWLGPRNEAWKKDIQSPTRRLGWAQRNKRNLGEMEDVDKLLRPLLKEKDVLVGDFYGINITAYRYVNVFDRLRYIRYRIQKIDEKIQKLRIHLTLTRFLSLFLP